MEIFVVGAGVDTVNSIVTADVCSADVVSLDSEVAVSKVGTSGV